MSSLPLPEIWIADCQEDRLIDVTQLDERAPAALKEVLRRTDMIAPGFAIEMVALEVSLVSEEEICRLHAEFLNDPSPTDVITFDHGEIIIGVEAAVVEAEARGWPLERELFLYLIHGFLHLQGLEDHEPEEAEQMRVLQEEILELVWPLEAD
jgi:probable rRNA maturation factor